MKIKHNGRSVCAHSISTEELIEKYQRRIVKADRFTERKKDKIKIETVLRARGINIRKKIFIEGLSGSNNG